MKKFLDEAANQNHPLRALKEFLDSEEALEKAKLHDKRRFVGYALDIGYGEVKIITCDPFKIAVGGIPRNSLLIMCPSSFESGDISIPPHFTLLRVLDAAPTPLSAEVQQTYFELQKKSMPELDIFTQSELQWGALKSSVLGMFYPHPQKGETVEFSGDLNNFVSAHKYRVYAPDNALLDLVTNSLVPKESRFMIGKLRLTECRLPLPGKEQPDVNVYLSTKDFMGCRTAMFGKTRLGKSNIVKLICQSLIETTSQTKNVGQLIFDINGEYANDNPQDDNLSIRSVYPNRCIVYALNQKANTPSKLLRLNFYEDASSSKQVLNSLIRQSGRGLSDYINAFLSVELPEIGVIEGIPNNRINEKIRAIRRLQYYWALLHKAGFPVDENKLISNIPSAGRTHSFNPGFSADLRNAAYQNAAYPDTPPEPKNLDELVRELEILIRFKRENRNSPLLVTANNNPLFDQDDNAILEILEPQPGRSGIIILLPFRIYHDQNAGNYKEEIIKLLDEGQTVILDLGNANEEVVRYFSGQLSEAVFYHQMDKFTSNKLGDHFIQICFEEAHNLFAINDTEESTKIYRRFAKEGAKYHIGMVYSTQSPTTISPDLLAQTENFFVAHLASQDDVNRLSRLNIAYESLKDDILRAKTVGYIRMLTKSHRFVVSMQALKFSPPVKAS
jgi:DNA helicase HerA-like ATPase